MLYLPLANILYSFQESLPAGKVIVLLLFAGSIFVWTTMINKFFDLRRSRLESERFVAAFRKEKNPVALFLKRQRFDHSPLYRVYEKGCLSVGGELEVQGVDSSELFMGSMSSEEKLNHLQLDAVRNATDRTVAEQALNIEAGMGALATAVTASPFLGLLGTVWGVMGAFSAMARVGSAQLSAVAPGIAGALLTTVVGLLVALPSAIGYNLLTSRVRRLQVQMDNFAQEFMADVQRVFLDAK